MTASDRSPNRLLVLVITLTCFAAAGVLWAMGAAAEQQLAFSGLIRVGVCMGALWLALPSSRRSAAWRGLSPWVIVAIAVAVFLIPRLRFSIPIVIGMLLLGMFVKPKRKPGRKTTIPVESSPSSGSEP